MKNTMDFKTISAHKGPEKSPGFLLWHISTSWRSAIEKTLKNSNLTHPQFVVLATLGWLTKDGALVTQSAVGKLAGIDPNTLSQIIRGLEKKDLVVREKLTDGRAKNPKLTRKGSALVKKTIPEVEKTDEGFFSTLSKKEMETLLSIFHKMLRKD